MIEVKDLTIHYGSFAAVEQLSFNVNSGSVFGLIGPNGAGKTSVLKAIATLLEPTFGEIIVQGQSVLHQPEQARSFLGYMPDFPPVYEDLKVWEFCDLFAQAYGLRGENRKIKVLESLHATGLNSQMDSLCKTLSRGMRQRALLAKTLVHGPSVLLLDEPAANLDPKSRIDLRNIIQSLAKEGKTVLLSSHILSEIEDTCDTLGFMRNGKMVQSGTLEEIDQARKRKKIITIGLPSPFPNLQEIIASIPCLSVFETTDPMAKEIKVCFDGDEREAARVLNKLVQAGVPVSAFVMNKTRVEDLFLELESQPEGKE
jgi:ABC-2 type transport system ATP-binding protein